MKFSEAIDKAKGVDCEHAVPVLLDWHRSDPDDPGTVACLAKAGRYEDDIECDHMDNCEECPSWHARILVVVTIVIIIAVALVCGAT